MLVDGLDAWPADQMSLGTEGDLYYLVFPRAHGRARLYLLHDLAQRGRFAGPDRQARFLDAFRFRCLPDADVFRAARPAGPCAFYPMNDTWTDDPCAPGVVLIGDAAGWNDPIIGQGLSIALRDVRMVADVVRAGPDRSVAAFTPYVAGAAGADAAAADRGGGPDRARRPPSPRPARRGARRSTRSSAPTRCSAARGWPRSWGRRTCRRRRSARRTSRASSRWADTGAPVSGG